MDAFFTFADHHAFWAFLIVCSVVNGVRGLIVGSLRALKGIPVIQVAENGKVRVRR